VKSRSALLICLIILAMNLLPPVQSSRSASAPEIGLGFGPSNVQPVSYGTPIYTQGDNMWVESYYNVTIVIELQSPNGSEVIPLAAIVPGQLFDLYQFSANDTSGVWRVIVSTSAGVTDVPILLVSTDSSLVPLLVGEHLDRNELNQTFNLPSTDAYNIEACTIGESAQHLVGFGLLNGLNGTIYVTLSQQNATFTIEGLRSSISLWLELYSQYSFELNGGGTASQNLMAASTQVASFSPPGGKQTALLTSLLPLRLGRFDLRVFVRTTSGLALHDFQFLRRADGSWTSLGSCTSISSVSSPVLSLATNLDSANSSWPRQLLTMYTFDGQESYTQVGLPGKEAAIHLRGFPEGTPLSGVSITASAPGLQSTEWDSYNSSVYVLTNGNPITLSLNLSFSGVISRLLNVSVLGSYGSKSLSVPAGTLVASTTLQGSLFRNATMTVAAPASPPVVIKQTPPGSISLLLPPDNYTVSAAYSGGAASKSTSVTPGHTSTVAIDLTPASVPVVTYLLVAAGVVGVIANVIIWRQYLERRKVYS